MYYFYVGVIVDGISTDSLIQEEDSLRLISPYLRKIDPTARKRLWTREKIVHLGTGYDAGECASQADGLIVHLLTFRDAGILRLLNKQYDFQKVCHQQINVVAYFIHEQLSFVILIG
jgi:hypothetical protein